MMKKLVITSALALAMGISATANAHPDHTGYATTTSDAVWMTGGGDCWKISNWSEDKMTVDCGAEAPAPAPAPEPAPKMVTKMVGVEESHIVYFDYDSSEVTDVSPIVNYVGSMSEVTSIELKGYTDRLGSNEYNDALSQRRVDAVSAALADAGIDSTKVSGSSYGEADPVKECTDTGAALKSCLGENRRVEVKIMGQKQVKVQQ